MITFFTIPRAFKEPHATWMKNAIISWGLLKPRPRIMLYGHEKGIAKISRRYGCIQRTVQKHRTYDVPLIDTTFGHAQKTAETRLMCFLNTDIILMQDFMDAVVRVSAKFDEFLMVGRKTDVGVNFRIEFARNWEMDLRDLAHRKGKLHGGAGIDYFVFVKGLYLGIPPFLVGRTGWDNWLVAHILDRNIPVVDATRCILAVHQHLPGIRKKKGPAFDYNRKLAGKAGRWGRINYAPWILTPEDIRERCT